MKILFRFLDPRRGLATAIGWLAALLSLAIALAVVWIDNDARDQLLAVRDSALVSAAESMAAEVDTALGVRLAALDELRGAATPSPGVAGTASAVSGASGDDLDALRPELGALVGRARERSKLDRRMRVVLLGNFEQVMVDSRAPDLAAALGVAPGGSGHAAPMPVLSSDEVVLQRPDIGRRQLAVKPRIDQRPALRRLGLHLILMQPVGGSLWQGSEVRLKIAWITLALSVVAALIGIAFARGLTRRLTRLTAAVKRVGTDPNERLNAPAGQDEVSALGQAFSMLLDSLRHERDARNTLTAELEERVKARTREVELLAADNRYAAVVRERLRLARDLHDTLAHSMMAMLAEIRTLRKLYARDPAALAPELERAERVAHDGLKEARDAIGQMRLDPVRDLGLGPALASAVNRFADRTGVEVRYTSDRHAASFADSRAEAIFRIAEEALHNVERHAHASQVDVSLLDGADGAIELSIDDDGVGFDPAAPQARRYGLLGIREQAQLIDAELSLTSEVHRGTSLRLRLRVEPESYS